MCLSQNISGKKINKKQKRQVTKISTQYLLHPDIYIADIAFHRHIVYIILYTHIYTVHKLCVSHTLCTYFCEIQVTKMSAQCLLHPNIHIADPIFLSTQHILLYEVHLFATRQITSAEEDKWTLWSDCFVSYVIILPVVRTIHSGAPLAGLWLLSMV